MNTHDDVVSRLLETFSNTDNIGPLFLPFIPRVEITQDTQIGNSSLYNSRYNGHMDLKTLTNIALGMVTFCLTLRYAVLPPFLFFFKLKLSQQRAYTTAVLTLTLKR